MSNFELVVPDHLSRSQVDTYSDCGRKWLLERGMRVPRVPAWALLGGSAVHAVTEEYDKAALDGTELDDEYLREAFALDLESRIREEEDLFSVPRARFSISGRASKDWPNKEDEAWWKHHGPAMVLNWKSWRRVTPWELLLHVREPSRVVSYSNEPMRLRLPKFIQMKNARPTMLASGTKPQ